MTHRPQVIVGLPPLSGTGRDSRPEETGSFAVVTLPAGEHARTGGDRIDSSTAGPEHQLAAAVAEAERQRRRARRAFAQRERHAEALRRLQDQLDTIEASTLWRTTRPLRWLGTAMPPSLRRNGVRIAKIVWWAATLQLLRHWRCWRAVRAARAHISAAKPVLSPEPVAEVAAAPVALVVDYRWPQPDRDAGSVEIMNLVSTLIELRFRIVFSANCDYAAAEADQNRLRALGVRCVPAGAALDDFLRQEGRGVELCVLNRVFGGGAHYEAVSLRCPMARFVFNTIDLHFLRAEREARLHGDDRSLALSEEVRAREEFIADQADATVVVSSHEREVLAAALPDAYVIHLPLARDIVPPETGFDARGGIGFIAGFAHAPNLDALRFFLAEIWPSVLREMPDCEFSIVGSDLPREELRGVPGRVRYLGHVPDVGPWFESLRLTIAPLRYGAGAKGKIASSLAAGVPCVTTTIGVEGMGLSHGVDVLTADDCAAFAARICEAYTDRRLWERLSQGALAYAAARMSLSAWKRELREMLWTIGAIADIGETEPAAAKTAASDAAQQDVFHVADHPVDGEGAAELASGSRYARA